MIFKQNVLVRVLCGIISFLFLNVLSGCSSDRVKDLTGTWEMTAYRINQLNEEESMELTWTFAGDGEFHQVIRYHDQEVGETARWSLSGDSLLIITYADKKRKVEWKIARLGKSTLEVEHFTPGFFVERGFIRKGNAVP